MGTVGPREIFKGEKELRIVWQDGHESSYPFRNLRLAGPCAKCRDEFTGRALLDPASVAADVTAPKAELVGNYALTFGFSDGHATGIYSFETLRALCPCSACAARR